MTGSAVEEFIPHPYQERAIDDVIDDPFHGEFMDPGVGKTAIILESFCRMRAALDVSRLLVVAPLRVCHMTWPEEIAKWARFSELSFKILHGDTRDTRDDADIFLINPEGLKWLFGQRNKKRTRWIPGAWSNWVDRPEMLVVDELTRFKRSTGVWSKTLKRYLGDFGRRNGMTGTPAPNGLLDLHGQMLVIDRGEALDWRITKYKKNFFVPVGDLHDRKWEPKAGAAEEIYDLIAPRITRLDARDYLDLPKRIVTEVPVVLPKRAKALYDRMHRDGCVELADGTEVLAAGDSSTGKCRQIANGALYTSPPWSPTREWSVIHTQKIEALQDLVGQIGRPTMVVYEFLHDAGMITKALSGVETISGKDPETAAHIIDKWNAGELPVLLVHPLSGGVGLNLQRGGNSIIWYAPTWDLEQFQQTVGRLERQGQPEPNVFVYFLVARGTVDARVVRVLQSKEATQEALLDALREEFE